MGLISSLHPSTPKTPIGCGTKTFVCSKFIVVYSIMAASRRPLRVPKGVAFQSIYNHVGGFSEGDSSINLVLWPLTSGRYQNGVPH